MFCRKVLRTSYRGTGLDIRNGYDPKQKNSNQLPVLQLLRTTVVAVYSLLVYNNRPRPCLTPNGMRVTLSPTLVYLYPLTKHAFHICYDSIPLHKPQISYVQSRYQVPV